MKSTELWGFLWQGTRAAHPTEATKESGGSHGSAFASLEKVCKEATLMKLGRQHQWLNASFLYHKNCLEVSRPAKIYTIICYCVNENQATKSLYKSCVRFERGGEDFASWKKNNKTKSLYFRLFSLSFYEFESKNLVVRSGKQEVLSLHRASTTRVY